MEPTPEMLERFAVRTRRHIALVARNLVCMHGYLGLSPGKLDQRACAHDLSKYDDQERLGYVWLTWIYHCKEQGHPLEIDPAVSACVERALQIHRARNSHHPEAHACPDAMSPLDLVEMVCDWTAIAQEQTGAGSARPWAEQHISRWAFAPRTRAFIFRAIDELDRRNARSNYERRAAR
jgi:uncharacterized protein DUF5662